MEDRIVNIPTRKKQAIAALCLARFCSENQIEHARLTQLIEHLLSVLVSTNLPAWDAERTKLELNESMKMILPQHISESTFRTLINSVLEVGLCNMYTGPSEKPLQNLQKCIDLLKNEGLIPPTLPSDLYVAERTDRYWQGWGQPLTEEEYKRVLECYRKIAGKTE